MKIVRQDPRLLRAHRSGALLSQFLLLARESLHPGDPGSARESQTTHRPHQSGSSNS